MPMFPLGVVLLPGAVLPLHVFEPRYRALVRDCLAAPRAEFGVTLIERGSEVGGGDQRATVGTVARMVQVAELDDGRYAVLAVGTRRVRVGAWLADDPYPRADVVDWPDGETGDQTGDASGELVDRLARVTGRVRRAAALASELGDGAAGPATELSTDPAMCSYQLAALAPIGPADAFRVLCAAGPHQRLDVLDEALADVEAVLEFRLGSSDPTLLPGDEA